MTKSQLIARLLEKMPHKSKKDIEGLLIAVFEEITKALESGHRVELRGFGSFFIKQRDPRIGCDPRSGKTIRIDTRHIPFFRPGKSLLENLNH
jgi:integration host factor subunit beta